MVQVNPITVRVKFKKVGNLQYVSHLDLVRTMMKVLVRADLPLKYTEGFNPKPKLSFTPPLSTGVESVTEYMDIKLTEKMDEAELLSRLNKNLTDELLCLEAYYPTTKFTDLMYIGYDIDIDTQGASSDTAEEINSVLSRDSLFILKKTKSGEREVDIRPLIKEAEATYNNGIIHIAAILSSSSAAFLSPELLIKVLRRECGILSSDNLLSEGYTVMRREAYFENMAPFK